MSSTNLTETWCADCHRQLTIDESRMQVTWCHDLPGWRCASCYMSRVAERTGSREALKHLRIKVGMGACRLSTRHGEYLTNDPAQVTCPACLATPQFSAAVATPEPRCQCCGSRKEGLTACRRCGAARCRWHINDDGFCVELGRVECHVPTRAPYAVHRCALPGQPLSPSVCGAVQDGDRFTDAADEVTCDRCRIITVHNNARPVVTAPLPPPPAFWIYCEAAPPRWVVESAVTTLDAPVAGQPFQVPLVWSAALRVEAARHEAWYRRIGAARSQGRPDRDHMAPSTLDLYGGAVVVIEEQFGQDGVLQAAFGQRCTLCGAWLRRKDL